MDRTAEPLPKAALCKIGRRVRVASADAHFGEEPCLQGEHAGQVSGTWLFQPPTRRAGRMGRVERRRGWRLRAGAVLTTNGSQC